MKKTTKRRAKKQNPVIKKVTKKEFSHSYKIGKNQYGEIILIGKESQEFETSPLPIFYKNINHAWTLIDPIHINTDVPQTRGSITVNEKRIPGIFIQDVFLGIQN